MPINSIFLSVPSKDNLIEMTNFDNLDRMKSLVSVCICKRRQPRSSRSFGDGGHVLCGKEAECPREDMQITKNKCIVREKRNIKYSFSYIPKPKQVSKRSLGVVVNLYIENFEYFFLIAIHIAPVFSKHDINQHQRSNLYFFGKDW